MGWPPTLLLRLVHLDRDILRTRATVVLEQRVITSFLSHGDHPAHWLLQLLRRWRAQARRQRHQLDWSAERGSEVRKALAAQFLLDLGEGKLMAAPS